MNDVPTLSDASWMIRGLGFGVVLGTALEHWLPFQGVLFAGAFLVVGGQYLAFRFHLRSAKS
jgi:hypothetical protein